MELTEAIMTRRSIRRYKPDPVADEVLERCLEAARWAPSWANTQCWRFVIVRDNETRQKLAAALKSARPEGKNAATEAVKGAPVIVIACAQLQQAGYYQGHPTTDKGDWYMFDVALAMQNLVLAAHAEGLGTVLIGLFDVKRVEAILGLPSGFSVVAMTPLGYPDQEARVVPRKELSEIVSYEKFGGKK